MPLLNESLTIWEIAHRWNGLDPAKFRLAGIPLGIKDSIRLMMEAMLDLRLAAVNMSTQKRHKDSDVPKELFIRTHLDDFYDCVNNGRINKKLVKFIAIERHEFKDWCERTKIPLPEFWFPKDWERGEIAPSITGLPTVQINAVTSVSEVAQKAAAKRHEPLNQLKREFCDFWGKGKFKSRADAARRFHKALPPDKKKLLVESNAVRTLTQALAKHLPPKGKQ